MPLVDNFIPTQAFGRSGSLAEAWQGQMQNRDWVRLRQPWLDSRGRACVTITNLDGKFSKGDSTGGEPRPVLESYLIQDLLNRGLRVPVTANATSLHQDAWKALDAAVVTAARQPMVAAADLEASNSVPIDPMRKMIAEYRAISDPGKAIVDMDATSDGPRDTPIELIRAVPITLTHCDFGYSDRELQVSRSGGSGFDVSMGDSAAARVGESIEDNVLGNVTGRTYGTISAGPGAHSGTSTVYGYRTFGERLTKTNFTAPVVGSFVPDTAYQQFLQAIKQLKDQYHFGPYKLYYSTDWDPFMHQAYSTSGGNHPGETLHSMLMKHPSISGIMEVPRLTATFTIFLVQMQGPTAPQMISGMDVNTIQWEEKGGLEHRFKVIASKTPRMRSDYNERTSILHGTTA